VNSKQILAAASAVVLIVILVYPSVSVGTLTVSLTSSKLTNAEHLYVTINTIWAHPKGQATGGGWVLVYNKTVNADLAALQNSSMILGSGQISSGDYDQIRIEVSNATWVFNKTSTPLGVASPEIDGNLDFTVGAAKATTILITLTSQKELIANSDYFTSTMNATLTT